MDHYFSTWVCPILFLYYYLIFILHLPRPLASLAGRNSFSSTIVPVAVVELAYPPYTTTTTQHDTWISSFRARSSEEEPPSPPRTFRAHSSSSRPRTGIVFPLQPRQRRPDTYINVEAAALPEPAALQRDDPLPSREVPTDLTRPAQRPARKRRRKRSSALYCPAKRSPPWGRWCII